MLSPVILVPSVAPDVQPYHRGLLLSTSGLISGAVTLNSSPRFKNSAVEDGLHLLISIMTGSTSERAEMSLPLLPS